MSTAERFDTLSDGVGIIETPIDAYERLKSISYENAKKFTPSINTKSYFMMDARRCMTSLTGSFDNTDCIFMVDHDMKNSTELFDVFYSDYFLSVIYDTMRLVYPQDTLRFLRFSPKTGLTQEQRDLLSDQSVAIFGFSKTTGKLLVVVPKAILRRVALQFLELNTKGQHVTDDNSIN